MHSDKLTPLRLFSEPPLTGGLPADLKFSPCGQYASYRRVANDDRERMDLWRVNLHTGQHEEWINARRLTAQSSDITQLTEEERAERERRRQFNHGFTQYSWHPNDHVLLVPMNGQALMVDVSQTPPTVTTLTPEETRQSGVQISPDGAWLSYVRGGNLFVLPLIDPQSQDRVEPGERQLTSDASETVSNGLADFLAAEEMHRFQGHWFSPDSRYIAYCKVDESPVAVSFRLEMQADGAQTIEQRYPFAGADNPAVSLWLYDLHSGTDRKIWHTIKHPDSDDVYLARVHFKAGHILIQTQDRRQQTLCLKQTPLIEHAEKTAGWETLYREQSTSWINLNDDLRILDDNQILLSSEQNGTRGLYVLDQGGGTRQLHGPHHVNAVLHADASDVYVTGWTQTPIENHFFKVSLSDNKCTQLTLEPGWHEIVMALDRQTYIDRHSSETRPPNIHLRVTDPSGDQSVEQLLWQEKFDTNHPYHPFIEQHSEAEFGSVAAQDGQRVHYRITPPASIHGKHATIVYVYGGPGPQKARREWSPLTVQLFAQNGFAVLEIDNRGTGNRGIEFESPIYRHMGGVEIQDQVAGLSALTTQPWADLARVGLFGHSYGGYMTLMGLCQAKQHFAAGVAVAPVCDWHLYDTHYTERYMGLPTENASGYEHANVLNHLHNLDAPLLLMHGMADDNVLFTHSTQIMAKLQSLAKPFELMTYPGAKHSMQEREVSIHRFNLILDFFNRHLNP